MSFQFYKYYNNIKKEFMIIKENKSKTVFTIKENNFKFKVNLKNVTCTMCTKKKLCEIKKCNHIYQLFNKYYNISDILLPFLWINNNHLKIINKENIQIDEKDIECPICLDSTEIIKKANRNIIHCLNCNKYYHKKCVNKLKGTKCPICYNNFEL